MGKTWRTSIGFRDIDEGKNYNTQQGRNDAPEVQSERIKTYGDNSPIVKPSKTLLSMV